MDRFIAFALNVWESAKGDLKSNMDRFIDLVLNRHNCNLRI